MSQVSTSFKRLRVKTSGIYENASLRDYRFYCNYCFKSFVISGGIGSVVRYLKKAHLIDLSYNSIAEKRIREGTAIDIAILRNIKINIKAEE